MGNTIIKLSHVQKAYAQHHRKLPIVDVQEWMVQEGECVALLGPSGSGKSTILHLISGVLKADQGELEVCGHPLHRMSETERDRFRAVHIGYIMQDFHLLGSLTARQNVELVIGGSISKKAKRVLVEDWLERVGLGDRMNHLPAQLSRGQQQRVAIVRALINTPQLVLADEPTGSLDWETAGETMRLILELCREMKRTLLTVTHDLHLAEWFEAKVRMEELNGVLRSGASSGAEVGRATVRPAQGGGRVWA